MIGTNGPFRTRRVGSTLPLVPCLSYNWRRTARRERLLDVMSLTAGYRGTTWHREVRAHPRTVSHGGLRTWALFAWPVGLYALTVVILLWQIGEHPAYAYNWEQYTARDFLTFWAHPAL